MDELLCIMSELNMFQNFTKLKIERQQRATSSRIEDYCKHDCFLGLGSHLFSDDIAQLVQAADLDGFRRSMQKLSY